MTDIKQTETKEESNDLDKLYKRMANCSADLIVEETYFTAWQQMAGNIPNIMVNLQKDNLAKVEQLTKLLIDIQKGDSADADRYAKLLIEIQENYLAETERCAKLLNDCLNAVTEYYNAVNNLLEAQNAYDDAVDALTDRNSDGWEQADLEEIEEAENEQEEDEAD